MRKTTLIFLTGLLLAFSAGCRQRASAANGLADYLDASYSSREYWFDGTAEINLYQAHLTFYGARRPVQQLVHILVTEDHDPELLVKAERQPGLVKMLKFNYLQRVQTGVYEYRQMMSAFFEHGPQRFVKMTYSSQEWCGHSFKEIVRYQKRHTFDFNTYWDGQGNGSFPVAYPDDLVLYDTLPAALRSLKWQIGLSAEFDMLPSQFSSRVQEPAYQRTRVEVAQQESIEVPAGRFEAFRVEVLAGERQDLMWFEADFPHRMIRWQRSNGDSLELEKSRKLPYWQLNQPGDEARLQ